MTMPQTLTEIIAQRTGKQKHYLLLRISGLDTATAMGTAKITKALYNAWCRDKQFVEIHRKVGTLESEHKVTAIQLLRRNNQLEAVLLEARIIFKMKEEIESGDYDLTRTNLAREVYSKLMAELDATPKVQVQTWEQKIGQIINNAEMPKLVGGIVDAEFTEASPVKQEELPESCFAEEDTEVKEGAVVGNPN
jgi:hypothetical protein